jgi:hypothetical protein
MDTRYDCVLNWGWGGGGSSFQEERRFTINNLDEIPEIVRRFIVAVTRRYVGIKYEGRIERYNIWIGGLEVTPILERIYLYPDENADDYLKNEWELSGQLLESDTLFVDSNYNMKISDKNIGKQISFSKER